MIDLGHVHGRSGKPGKSKLAYDVLQRLPAKHMLNDRDRRRRDEYDGCLQVPPTNEAVTAATKAACAANHNGPIDPFELLTDADICDSMREPIRPPT